MQFLLIIYIVCVCKMCISSYVLYIYIYIYIYIIDIYIHTHMYILYKYYSSKRFPVHRPRQRETLKSQEIKFFPRRSTLGRKFIRFNMLRASYQGGKGDDVGHARVWKEGTRGFYSLHQIRALPYPAVTWGQQVLHILSLFLDIVAYLPAIYELILRSTLARDTNIMLLLTSVLFNFYCLKYFSIVK